MARWPYGNSFEEERKFSSNLYGADVSNSDFNDSRFIEQDYSIGGGVTMIRTDFEHGFGHQKSEHVGKGPKNWKRNDHQIKDEICEKLYLSSFVDASDIKVQIQDGEVFLKGWVEDREEKKEAERCAEKVAGVSDVFNELHLRNRKL